jgi:hypothetical protein
VLQTTNSPIQDEDIGKRVLFAFDGTWDTPEKKGNIHRIYQYREEVITRASARWNGRDEADTGGDRRQNPLAPNSTSDKPMQTMYWCAFKYAKNDLQEGEQGPAFTVARMQVARTFVRGDGPVQVLRWQVFYQGRTDRAAFGFQYY